MSGVFTHHFNSPLYKGTVSVNTGLFIDGKWVASDTKELIDIINPANGSILTKVSVGATTDVDLAVNAAQRAFKSSWGLSVPGFERGRLMYKLADLLEKNLDAIAAIEALDSGKHFVHTKSRDVPMGISNMRYFAGWADKNHGKTIETNESKFAYTRHEPIGVVGLIVPWNFPWSTALWKLSPALATGNTVVLKPSELTPLSALMLAAFVKEAGFPDGVFNVVTGYGSTAGQALVEHPLVGKVSFTGSTLIGRRIMETAAKTNLKRISLELGGKSPAIVFKDADIEQAVKWIVGNIFHHNGQICTAPSRIFVQEDVYDRFIAAFTAAAKSLKQGDPLDPNVQQGSIASRQQLDRILGYIESGKQEGARVLTGGEEIPGPGFFIRPTIFVDAKPNMRIVREEIFGPVAVVMKFGREDEALDLANDTEYGLSSYVFTQNISTAIRAANALEAGNTFINSASMLTPQLPFGGWKQSGQGQDMSEYALKAFTQVKAVHINVSFKL